MIKPSFALLCLSTLVRFFTFHSLHIEFSKSFPLMEMNSPSKVHTIIFIKHWFWSFRGAMSNDKALWASHLNVSGNLRYKLKGFKDHDKVLLYLCTGEWLCPNSYAQSLPPKLNNTWQKLPWQASKYWWNNSSTLSPRTLNHFLDPAMIVANYQAGSHQQLIPPHSLGADHLL